MTILRPITAVITAIVAGLGVEALDKHATNTSSPTPTPPPLGGLHASQDLLSPFDPSQAARLDELPPPPTKPTIVQRLHTAMDYGFVELLGDIGSWFLIGVALAGAVSAFMPDDLIASVLGRGFMPMLATLALSLPLYICATASTPVAAALAAKGLTPGAAMVFLVAGPATNIAALTVTGKLLGKKALAVYLAAIVICTLLMGSLVNFIYDLLGIDITTWLAGNEAHGPSLLEHIAAVALLGLIAYGGYRERRKKAA